MTDWGTAAPRRKLLFVALAARGNESPGNWSQRADFLRAAFKICYACQILRGAGPKSADLLVFCVGTMSANVLV